MQKAGIIHYDEIALKGTNRKRFENALVSNIAHKLSRANLPIIAENKWGRIVLSAKEGFAWDSEEHDAVLHTLLATTPGVTVFGIGVVTDNDEESISRGVRFVVERIRREFNTFRVTTTRVNKSYPLTSQELDALVGTQVLEFFNNEKTVKLVNADMIIRIEVLDDLTYIYIKESGVSGLPVGTSGKAVALLSGGFDSPVATHMSATRGIEPLLMHFHAYPQTSRAAMEKVEDLARVLRDVCGPIILAFVPLLDAQKEITLTAPEKLRTILYRRLMMKVAEEWGKENGAQAIITGESVGQVASQTIENISVVENATTLPILRPLCGMHKREIIDRSRLIGTHDISILPHDDTCTVFSPKKPETKARLEKVLEAEEKYDTKKLVAHMLERIEVHKL